MSLNMNGISPQSISRRYLVMKSLPFHNVVLQRALIQRSITARKSFNTPTGMGGNFRQAHSRNYCSPSYIAPKPKETPKTGDSSTGIDNSNITTRNHAYYQSYSISGFYPIVCTPPPPTKGLPKEDEQVKKTGPKQEEIKAKKTGHEHTCPVHSYSHAYYQQFSISGFYRFNNSPADSKPIKKPSTVEPKDTPKDEHVCSIRTCNHAYYRTFSISGFYPAPSSTPTNPESSKPTCIAPKISMAEALALAAAFIPSTSSHQKINGNMEHLNLEHDINTSAQTIEELGFEALGITGFQDPRDDMEGEKDMMEDDEKDGGAIEFREGGPGPVRAGLSAVWLLLSPV
ncbi:uncharacterized protein EAF02_004095 [Botrytis sinoallii]|uniref:uncharacterized protein n=1 Tax=Botrytis sinoallii TaxID=1463999 RepID=UPI0018FF5D8D|nr:uncharacterized protein EAF02_004095 [Botrytis sinoallii]KAF7885586.1 hypothetical protein EAF02_004095 [Botrytis sinoallii]